MLKYITAAGAVFIVGLYLALSEMEYCKSAERKHNWLGIAENWHLTLRLAQLSLTGEINTPSRECHSSSGMIVSDSHCSVCREVFTLDILKSILAADHRLLF